MTITTIPNPPLLLKRAAKRCKICNMDYDVNTNKELCVRCGSSLAIVQLI